MSETSAVTTRPPGLVVEVLAAVLAAVLVSIAGWLGWWQLDAWQARRTAEARDLTMLDPVPLTDVMGGDDAFPAPDVGRPVEVAGEWQPVGAFWVSDREQEGREGYWQVVPWAVDEADAAVLVVTGWAATTDAEPPSGEGRITGWLQPPEGRLVTDPDPNDDVFPQLRVADAVQRVDGDLYSAYVVLDHERSGDAPGALEPAVLESLPEAGRFTAVRNLLYAVEWWVFAAFAAFVWWRWWRDARAAVAAARDGEAQVTAEDERAASPADG